MKHISLRWAAVILAVMVMAGCASQRVASTMKITGDSGLELGRARFYIVDYADVFDGGSPPVTEEKHRLTAQRLQERAKVLYPRVFTDDWAALPVSVKAKIKHDSSGLQRAAIIGGFTLGLFPIPGTSVTSHEVITSVRDARGDNMADTQVNFDTEFGMWVTLLTPLGSLPVPGESDLPRDTVLLGIPLSGSPYDTGNKYSTYGADLMIEAVVQSLRSIDNASLEAACRTGQSLPQELSIDGQTYWSFLSPIPSQERGNPVSFAAMLYHQKPARGAKPYAQLVVARRDERGAWLPVNSYLRNTSRLTAVSTLLENGAPAKVIARVVEEPPLEDFIDTPDLSGPEWADNLRWSNGILLEAKNRSLENLLRYENRSTLLGLATRIEKSILDLNEQAERAKDRAQTMVEKGAGDPASDRELSILCRQRIEVLKPILSAVKQTAASRP
jgi:hypothetical protein